MMKYIHSHVTLLFIAFLSMAGVACQNSQKGETNSHIENSLSIEKAFYWHEIADACLNSQRYSEAIPWLDSLKQYCNYYEIACYNLSYIYLNSKELYNEQEGLKYLRQAAYGLPDCELRAEDISRRGYAGLPRAKYDMALDYLFGGHGIIKDEAKGIQLLDTLAQSEFGGWRGSIVYEDEGDYLGAKARVILASYYSYGLKGLPQDKKRAASLWNKALELTGQYYMDCADLLNLIGKEYQRSNNPYYKDAASWLLNDANPDEPTTQFLLALCYRFGKGVPRDLGKSNRMLREIQLDASLKDALYPLWLYISDGKL